MTYVYIFGVKVFQFLYHVKKNLVNSKEAKDGVRSNKSSLNLKAIAFFISVFYFCFQWPWTGAPESWIRRFRSGLSGNPGNMWKVFSAKKWRSDYLMQPNDDLFEWCEWEWFGWKSCWWMHPWTAQFWKCAPISRPPWPRFDGEMTIQDDWNRWFIFVSF